MTVDSRLPEELDEARQVKSIVFVGLQYSIVDDRGYFLEFTLCKHAVVHVMISIQSDQICNRDQLLSLLMYLKWILSS